MTKALARPSIGIDASILDRLSTGQPPDLLTLCIEQLIAFSEADAEAFASIQVIGEAYCARQHDYGVSKQYASVGLHTNLTNGIVAPLNGHAVLDALAVSTGPGLFHRLIANYVERAFIDTLTMDRSMASLPQARLFSD